MYIMPTHYGSMSSTKKSKPKKKGELTQRQKDALKKHSKHHTKKHISEMTKLMKQGKSFGESHKITQKKVGK